MVCFSKELRRKTESFRNRRKISGKMIETLFNNLCAESGMSNFKSLHVYGEAFELSNMIYGRINLLKELSLRDQLFRSSTSICANLAEYCAFRSSKQRRHILSICVGEANETEFWIDFCKEQKMIGEELHYEIIMRLESIRKKLCGLMRTIPVHE